MPFRLKPGLTLFLLFILSTCCGRYGYGQTLPGDPFLPYLTRQAPAIAEDLGTKTTPEGLKIHQLVFQSRMIDTPGGAQPSLVYAVIVHPAGPGPHPGMIRLHGGGGAADIPAAISSAKAGYASLVLDIPGITGNKKNPKTTGPWLKRPKVGARPDATHSALFDAVLASVQAFYLLRSQPGVDKHKMCVAGASWGGYTATMVASLVDQDNAATWSVFGTGNFLLGAYEKNNVSKLPPAEQQTWKTYLDPGSRAHLNTKPYFISTASNDRHWSWMAVQATMASMKGPTNQFYSPNTNHQVQYPGSSNMIYFFNQHVKKTGPAMQQVAAGKSKRLKDGRVEVSFAIRQGSQAKDTKVYYSDATTLWTERTWIPVEARRKGKLFRAYIPAEAAQKPFDWYAVATDVNPAAWGPDNLSTASLVQQVK